MMQIKFNFDTFIFCGVSATTWQRASGIAGGYDWPLPPAVGLSNNDIIALRLLRFIRCVRCVGWKPRFIPVVVAKSVELRRSHTCDKIKKNKNQKLTTVIQVNLSSFYCSTYEPLQP